MTILYLTLALLGTLAIFATTKRGKSIFKNLGFRDRLSGLASSEDVEYLRSACGGNRREAERLVEIERERFPDLSEAEHYRRAIRKVFQRRNS